MKDDLEISHHLASKIAGELAGMLERRKARLPPVRACIERADLLVKHLDRVKKILEQRTS